MQEGGHAHATLKDEALLAPQPAVGGGVPGAVVRGENNQRIFIGASKTKKIIKIIFIKNGGKQNYF